MASYVTTPELRVGPPPPYTNASLQINLFFRVFLGILANICCWVPMRLLWKNGEFSAAVYCVTIMTLNFYYVVNSLIWQDDNVQDWFAGYGWCDIQIYTVFAIQTLYTACLFAIMRNVATKVGMMRATSLTSSERRRRTIIEALIIFPFPLIQVLMTYFVLGQRYNVSTLIGCTNMYYRTWPYLVVYHIPGNAFAILTVIFAILTWVRFREVEKATRAARNLTSNGMHQRHQRIRRKLFFMCISILVPFFPMQMFWLYGNIIAAVATLQPYDFNKSHNGSSIFNLVTFTTSQGVSFFEMNTNYIPILTVLPLFWFFGVTKEAVNIYRVYLLNIGLGKWFPKLHEEYDPDRTRDGSQRSWGQQISVFFKSGSGSGRSSDGSRKNSILPTTQHVSIATSTLSETSRNREPADEYLHPLPPAKAEPSNPWPDLAVPEPTSCPHRTQPVDGTDVFRTTHLNPFLFRTMLATPIRIPTIPIFSRSSRAPDLTVSAPHQVPLSDYRISQTGHSDTKSLVSPAPESSDGEGVSPWTAVNAGGGRRASKGASVTPKVRTRVWSEEEEQRSAANGGGVEMGRSGAGHRTGGEDEEIGLAVGGVRVETRIAREEEKL